MLRGDSAWVFISLAICSIVMVFIIVWGIV